MRRSGYEVCGRHQCGVRAHATHLDSGIEDLMVASMALRNDAMLATRNTLDFDYLDTPP